MTQDVVAMGNNRIGKLIREEDHKSTSVAPSVNGGGMKRMAKRTNRQKETNMHRTPVPFLFMVYHLGVGGIPPFISH